MGRKVLHLRNGNNNVLPTPAQILVGEIAINYFKDNEMLAIKNSAGEVVTFSSDTLNNAYRQANERVVASALNDLEERKLDKSEAEDFITAETDPTVPAWAKSPTKPSYTAAEVGALPDTTKYGVSIYYDTENKQILLKDADNNTLGSPIDATAFIKDGMVSSASVTTPSEGVNAGVQCLVITFNTDAGKQPIEIPLSDFLTVDDELDATSENPLQNKVIKENLDRIELVTAAALNDINSKKADKSDTYTKSEVDNLLNNVEIDIDDALDTESENPVQNKVISDNLTRIEEVTSSALNDINDRKADKSDTYTKSEVDSMLDDVEITVDNEMLDNSENPVQNKVITGHITRIEKVTSSALNDLEERKLDKSEADDFLTVETDPTVPAWAKAPSKPSYDASEVVYTTEAATQYLTSGDNLRDSLEALDEAVAGKQDELTFDTEPVENSTNPVTSGGVYAVIADSEEVVAAALNDLEDRKLDKADAQNFLTQETDPLFTASPAYGITNGNITDWNSKQPGGTYVSSVQYDSTAKKIYFKDKDGATIASSTIDASDFIKDGMLSNAEVSGGNLVLTFNTDAGKQPIQIPLTDFVVVDDELLDDSANPVQNQVITANLSRIERVTSTALNDLEERKLDRSEADDFLTVETDPTVPAWAKAPSKPSYAASEIMYNESDVATVLDSIGSAITDKQDQLTFDTVPTANSTNPVTSGGLYTVIVDNEKVTAAAFNDIEQRKLDKDEAASTYAPQSSTYTKSEVDNLVQGSVVSVDDELLDDSENPVQNKVIAESILRIETVTAAALNDLNERTYNLGTDTDSLQESVQSINETIADIQDEIDSLSPEYTVNGKTGTASNPIVLDGRDIKLTGYTSPSNNTDYDPIAQTDTINQAFSKVIEAMTDNEDVAAAAINNLDARLRGVSSDLQTLIDNPVEPMVEVTYSELVALKNGGELAAGSWYRITDYQCTTTQTGTSSANHPFDIVVLALSNNTLSEEARAIQHEGDTYFAKSKLNAWQLKYSLENDKVKYGWADTVNGKGVVWYMKDEWNNECGYDFKNIMFTRALTNGALDNDNGTNTSVYTFNGYLGGNQMDLSNGIDLTVAGGNGYVTMCSENIIKSWYDYGNQTSIVQGNGLMLLNDNVFLCSANNIGEIQNLYVFGNVFEQSCYRNTLHGYAEKNVFGEDCGDNMFGTNCGNNMFGNNCDSNTFGNNCVSNTFGNRCDSNAFEYNCVNNTFGNYCYNNTFGESCYSNTFGDYCSNNTFGNYGNSNTFGNNCVGNTFGNSCGSNVFGHTCNNNTFELSCSSNTFGNSCGDNLFGNYCGGNMFGDSCFNNRFSTGTATINYVRYIQVENGVNYVDITTTATTSYSAQLQNITISQGVSGTGSSSRKTISHPTVGDTFQTIYRPANSQIVSV